MIVKEQSNLADQILEFFNRFQVAKQSGSLKKDELPDLITSFGKLFANKIRQGNILNEDIESVESYLSVFVGENSDKYFSFPHEGLENAAKIALQEISVAKQTVQQRRLFESSSIEQEDSLNMVRKLGH